MKISNLQIQDRPRLKTLSVVEEVKLLMYKIITHLYFNYRCREDRIFIPDSFDQSWNWNKILNNKNIKAIIPESSDSFLALQLVDIMTGLIGHGLRQKGEYSKRDFVREPLLKLFCEEANIKIKKKRYSFETEIYKYMDY